MAETAVSELTQTHRGFRIHGLSDLVLHAMEGEERLGRLFEYRLELRSMTHDIDFSQVVGQNVTVELDFSILGEEEAPTRYLNGYISDIAHVGWDGQTAIYRATMRPWLWLLSQTTACRIYQGLSLKEIVEDIFGRYQQAEFSGLKNLPPYEYCVQYRETDLEFVSRLMEQEGWYFYFRHENGKHTLVVADCVGDCDAGGGEIGWFHSPQGPSLQGYFDSWSSRQSLVPSAFASKDYDFCRPRVSLDAKQGFDTGFSSAAGKAETFDSPGGYRERMSKVDSVKDDFVEADERDRQENRINLHSEISKAQQARVFGSGRTPWLFAGCCFDFAGYPRKDQNQNYLVVGLKYAISGDAMQGGKTASLAELVRTEVESIPSSVPFRNRRLVSRPVVRGPQTATVIAGPGGSEINCDALGRVQVEFNWPQEAPSKKQDTGWIRVAQMWAGQGWGGVHIPRVGQEVVVSFLEGDPDRPLITGSVYNTVQTPPYTLPDNKTQSGIKSRSSEGGSKNNFNEVRMEDKKGSEELYIQAEKDENILVKNNKGETVGNDETINIGHDRTETVGNNETLTVAVDRVRNVGNNETVTVAKMRTHSVGINEAIAVGAAQEIAVGAFQELAIGAYQSIDVGAYQSMEVGGWQSISVGASQSTEIGSDQNQDIGGDRKIEVGDGDNLKVGKKLVYEVGDSVTIKCGSASIVMKKSGDVTIKGKNIVFKASSKIQGKASGNIILKGSAVKEN